MPITNSWRSGPSVSLEFSGLRGTAEVLRDIGDRAEEMRPAMLRIKQILIEGHTRQFRTQGAFLGERWEMNAPGTLARKDRTGVPSLSSTMVESGDLQESLEGGVGSRSRVSKSGVSVGTSLFYAVFHINPKREGMPARPPVGINDAQRRASLTILEEHLMGRGL